MLELIKRITPEFSDSFILEEKPCGDSGYYEVQAVDGKIVLRGDSKISLAMGYYRYLKDVCAVNLSRCGGIADLPGSSSGKPGKSAVLSSAPLPLNTISRKFDKEIRACYTFATYGYDLCFKGWDFWEHELDMLAMNGVNMPLIPVGYESVWYYGSLDLGINREDALSFVSGPAFFPWQMTGNLDTFLPIVDTDYLKSRIELGKKIIERAKELGMTPVLPSFTGHVAKFMRGYFNKSNINPVPYWCAFPMTYFVAPEDPLFNQIALALLKKQKEYFGECKYFSSSPYLENNPLRANDIFWQRMGAAVSGYLNEFSSDAVWVLQSNAVREPMVKAVDKEKLLILDISGKGAQSTDGFWGYNFVTGLCHNFGGRNSLHGNMNELFANPFEKIKDKYKNAVGTGLFSESFNQNPMLFDLAFEMLSEKSAVEPSSWLRSYALRRYGSGEDCLVKALEALCESCYSVESEAASLVCARPSTRLRHAAPNDIAELKYDNDKLFDAARLLLSAERARTDGYEFDVCDTVRQALSNLCMKLYSDTMRGYFSRDAKLFERSSNDFLRILDELDSLLSSRADLRVGTYIKEAASAGITATEKKNFEINLLTQITLWGPFNNPCLYDCAWKEWGGLVSSYYSERWHRFFEYLAKNFKKRRDVSTETKKQICERNEFRGNKFYRELEKFERRWIASYNPPKELKPEDVSEEAPGTLELATELVEKYYPIERKSDTQ